MRKVTRSFCVAIGAGLLVFSQWHATVSAQTAAPSAQQPPAPAAQPPTAPPIAQSPANKSPVAQKAAALPVVAPPGYVIGPDDQLTVGYWRDKELSSDVVVRPDGKISLPLINDIQAAGLTPEQLRLSIAAAAVKFIEDPTVMVVVKQINSRKVYIVGQVAKPGPYALPGPMTVLQLIATAGGVLEYADKENLLVVRDEKRPDGEPVSYRVNYAELLKRKNLLQNIELRPGDTVIIP